MEINDLDLTISRLGKCRIPSPMSGVQFIDDDKHVLIKTTDNYYVLKNTPKDPSGVEFSYYELWIHRESYIPVRATYYDAQGQAYRIYDVLKVETIQGCPTVTEARMQDLQSKGETVAEYSRIRYNLNVPPEVFTERYLRSSPVEYLE